MPTANNLDGPSQPQVTESYLEDFIVPNLSQYQKRKEDPKRKTNYSSASPNIRFTGRLKTEGDQPEDFKIHLKTRSVSQLPSKLQSHIQS